MSLDRSTQLAVDALIDKLKGMIEERVEKSDSRGSARTSWSLLDELKSHAHWTGDKPTDADRAHGERINASYTADMVRMRTAEAKVWKAIADLLKK